MSDLQRLKQYLSEAEDAEHQLNMGKSVVSVSHNGKTTQFNAASPEKLRAYISRLKLEISRLEGKKGGVFTFVL